jgi:hypothetical protein
MRTWQFTTAAVVVGEREVTLESVRLRDAGSSERIGDNEPY